MFRPLRFRQMLAALLALDACSTGIELPASGPVARYQGVGDGGASALFTGTIELGRDCLTVTSSEPGNAQRIIPLFHREASWRQDGLHFVGKVYAVGDTVSLGGAIADLRHETIDHYLPKVCDSSLATWLVQQDQTSLAAVG